MTQSVDLSCSRMGLGDREETQDQSLKGLPSHSRGAQAVAVSRELRVQVKELRRKHR